MSVALASSVSSVPSSSLRSSLAPPVSPSRSSSHQSLSSMLSTAPARSSLAQHAGVNGSSGASPSPSPAAPPPLSSSSSHHALFSLAGSHSRGGSHSDLQQPHLHHAQQQSVSTSPQSLQKMATIHHLNHEPELHYPCTADDYDIVQEIGIGAFATVYRATVSVSGEEVAIKVIDLEQFNTNWDEIRREIQIMSLLHHPNVVKILTSFIVSSDLWIVMPLLQAGSCAALMKQLAPNGFKDEALIATILRETLQGLHYFHKDGRIHRDLKAGNILIGSAGEVQLADFGVAGTLMENGDRKKNRQTFTGTPCWMAPEVMEHTAGYDEKADIWSFGITAMELGFGRAPYARFQPMKVMLLTISEEPPTIDVYKDSSYQFSKQFTSLIAKCLRRDSKRRPSAKKLMEHKFFKQARDRLYIIDRLVSRLPPRSGTVERIHVCREKTLVDAAKVEKSKPVSVGSWSFDSDELAEMKQRALEEKAGQRESQSARDREEAVENSYHHHHSDSDEHDDDEQRQQQQLNGAQCQPPHDAPLPSSSLYHEPVAPHEIGQVGRAGEHETNVRHNEELQVADERQQRPVPIPSFSPVQRQQEQQPSSPHQEGRFMVSEEEEEDSSNGGSAAAPMRPGPTSSSPPRSVVVGAFQPASSFASEANEQQHSAEEEHVGRFSIRDE